MTVRKVLRMGEPLLLTIAEPVTEFNNRELDALIIDMRETMAACDGAGLAAPQIGVPLRVVIFGIDHNPRYPDVEPITETILINPQIEAVGNETDSAWEGCLSVPGMRGLVPRHTHIRYRGMNQKGEEIIRQASHFHARVVQHECDHLDGVLYPQRITDMRHFGFTEELFSENSAGNPSMPCETEK